jgi:hypothetical protein
MKYRKKPVVIEAFQFSGRRDAPGWPDGWLKTETEVVPNGERFFVKTLEGYLLVTAGDWIIKGVKGEFYPCKPDIFEKSYELVRK